MARSLKFVVSGIAVVALGASIALAQTTKETKPAAKPATPAAKEKGHQAAGADAFTQACEIAGKPGAEHAKLVEGAGVWSGKTTCWMMGPEAQHGTCTTTVTPMFDNRFVKIEYSGESPMGPFKGVGFYGFDNVSKEYQATWIDNCSTGMAMGKGEASSDGKTMTWTYTYNCPMTKKPTTLREVHTKTGKDTETIVMWGTNPETGEEMKMMESTMTRTGAVATAGSN
jgi:hypothetical protein